MRSPLSLATRTFLFSFLSMCLVLTAGFYTVGAVIKFKIKSSLKETMHRMESLLDKTDATYNQRNRQLIAILSENAGLKAGIGLLREGPSTPEANAQIRQTIEAQLRDLSEALDYDLLWVSDSDDEAIAALQRGEKALPLESIPKLANPSGMIRVGEALYQATTIPINLGAENLGSLTVGNKFDLNSLNTLGFTALLQQSNVLETTLPGDGITRELQHQLRTKCSQVKDGCEISLGGETYLALQLERSNLGEGYVLLSLQSVDKAMHDFTGRFKPIFLSIGAVSILAAFMLSAITSRSISSPLSDLISRLRESKRTGKLWSYSRIHSATKEVNLLAEAFNQAAKAISESQDRLDEAYLQFIETMAQALDARDPYTAGHSSRVSFYSTAIAQAMGLSPEQIQTIDIGARLHDIGKIGVPDALLQKPGRLTDEEFAKIKLHPQIGKKILERVGRFQDYLPIVELHHEDFNGKGYPYGLSGEQIPLDARIVHVADVYDAITSDRAYRKAMSTQRVVDLMRNGSGTQFDPKVVEIFLGLLQEWELQEERALVNA
ncbi:MAG: HD-GYP domain-containing protein [Terriglobia bacterium]